MAKDGTVSVSRGAASLGGAYFLTGLDHLAGARAAALFVTLDVGASGFFAACGHQHLRTRRFQFRRAQAFRRSRAASGGARAGACDYRTTLTHAPSYLLRASCKFCRMDPG